MRYLLLLTLIAFATISQAQEIKGLAKDENGSPLNGATISLIRSKDSAVVKLAVTKPDGVFTFSGIPNGSYKVKGTFVGFKPGFSDGFTYEGSTVTVSELKMMKITGTMSNVTVTASRPIVEVKADKTILNVEGTVNAVGSDALDLLRKSPGVLLDKDDNISMSGKNGVQVYIDGRPVPLSGADLATQLKSLQSAQIESIELITNPSAKYDAAGNAGIINIRLKKNKSLGTNGSVNAGWNMGKTAKYNGGASLNHRNKDLNLFSTYNFNYGRTESEVSFHRTILDSLFDQKGTFNDKRESHNFKFGADHFINKKNTIGVMVNGIISSPGSNTSNTTYISNTNTNVVDRILVANNNNRMKRNNMNVNLNYSYVDPKGTGLTVNADRGSYDMNSDQMQPNRYFDASGQTELNTVINHMISPAKINIHSVKADYEQNFMKGKLEVGGKSAIVKTDNDFRRYNVTGSSEELDKDRSNHFIYKENINAGYVNYRRQLKTMTIQFGVRVENTISKGNSEGFKYNGTTYVETASDFKRTYTDFFPSAAITCMKDPKRQWGITYSRRIDRPAYQDLNPFEFKLDEYTFMKGNINLRPQYTNTFGITHTYKFKLNMSLNYSHVKDMFTQMFDTIETSKAFISKKNLATQDIVSFNISYPFQYKSFSLFTNVSSNYSKYKADFGTGRKVDLNAFGLNVFAQGTLKFAKTWTAEMSGFFNAPTVQQGSFKAKSMYNMDAGVSKQLFNGKATVKASVSDVFHTMRFRAVSEFAGQTMNFQFRPESQQFKLACSFRFGNTGVKPARQRTTGAEDELKRVQQGGGIIGN